MIRYLIDGRQYTDKEFLPGEIFMANVFRLLKQKSCTAEVSVLPVIEPAGKQRRELAAASEAAVRAAFERENGRNSLKSTHG
jgi:hypothetical protein